MIKHEQYIVFIETEPLKVINYLSIALESTIECLDEKNVV